MLHLPLSHTFFPFPTSPRHQRGERQKRPYLAGTVRTWCCAFWTQQVLAVVCSGVCMCAWGFLAIPLPGTCELTSLEADPWGSMVQFLPSDLSPFQVVTENPRDRRLLWDSEPVLGKIHTFDPLGPLPAVVCSNPFPMEAEQLLSKTCRLLEAWVCPGDSGQNSRWFPHIALTFL